MTSISQINSRIAAHKEYCEENNVPMFIPSHGICSSCRKQIFDTEHGRSVITRCGHCNKSYCD